MEAIRFTFGGLELTNEVINRLAQLGYTPESLKKEINLQELECERESPALYCGTYGKYNEGNLGGMWVHPYTFNDYEDFINFCKAIHADEEDPELMFQDYANIPGSLYHESMGEEGFNKISEYCDMCDEYGVMAVEDFLEFYSPEDLDRMADAYVGVYDSKEDFAREMVNDCYDIEKMMGDLAYYFDYEAFARDLFISDYHFGSNGTVLRTF